MLSRIAGNGSLVMEQTRNFATLKDIAMRLKSVKNIQKITKSMKMVSASKFIKAERELKPARPYGIGAKEFYEKASVKPTEESLAKNHLIVAIASDRGLCGAANSSIARAIRIYLEENPQELDRVKIVCVGDKSRSILQRNNAKRILFSVSEVGKKPPTFEDAALVAASILDHGDKFETASMYFNVFKSVVAYETTKQPLYGLKTVAQAEKINLYDSVDDDVLQSYNEFLLTSLIYYAMKEASASEQSARMTAMDGASKNAGEMIDKMTMLYNRTRQAVITRELIEIISGASALKKE
jgi:F-type H+-transporting ATPase subunit gamma